jgi:hypothetical protein
MQINRTLNNRSSFEEDETNPTSGLTATGLARIYSNTNHEHLQLVIMGGKGFLAGAAILCRSLLRP